jgi:gluconolactonase
MDHPECLAFVSESVLIAGGEAGQIYGMALGDGTPRVIADTGGCVLGVSVDGRGQIYACDCRRNQVLKIDSTGAVSVYSAGTPEHPAVNPNYCAFDAEGNLFYSASGEYFHTEGTGRLFCVSPDGRTRCVHPGPLRFPNGLCLDLEKKLLYVVESTAHDIVAFALDGPALGSLDPVRRIELERDTVPDGIALDRSGKLVVAYYTPDQIAILDEDGSIEELYRDFTGELLNRPTNIALAEDSIYFSNLGGTGLGRIRHRCAPAPLALPGL